MIKKKLSFLLLFIAILGFATWRYRLLSVLLLVLLNKNWIKSCSLMSQFKQSYKLLILSLLVAIFIAIPTIISMDEHNCYALTLRVKALLHR